MLVTLLGIVVFLHPATSVLEFVSIIALQFSRESKKQFPASTVIEVRLEQYEKTLSPMLVTLLGIVMAVRLMQPENALFPISVTLLGMVMEVRPEQLENAELPLLVTLIGMMVFLHPAIRLFVFVSIIALQLSLESYVELLSSTIIVLRDEQFIKTIDPIVVTLSGMVIVFNFEQFLNANGIRYLQ